MKKILIVTAIWQRHDLTSIVLDWYNQIKQSGEFDLELLAVGSEGMISRKVAQTNGWDYVEFENKPVSCKFNFLFREAKKYDPDFILLVGSDDIISTKTIKFFSEKVSENENDIFGLKDLFFYDIQTDSTVYFGGYPPPSPKTIGAGRCFSRNVLQKCNYKPWGNDTLDRGLDTSCTNYLQRFGVGERVFTMKETGGVCLDIKHPSESLTPFEFLNTYSNKAVNEVLEVEHLELIEKVQKLRKTFNFDLEKMYRVFVTKEFHNGRRTLYWKKNIEVNGKLLGELASQEMFELGTEIELK